MCDRIVLYGDVERSMSNHETRQSYEPQITLSPPGCTSIEEIHFTCHARGMHMLPKKAEIRQAPLSKFGTTRTLPNKARTSQVSPSTFGITHTRPIKVGPAIQNRKSAGCNQMKPLAPGEQQKDIFGEVSVHGYLLKREFACGIQF